MTSVPLAAGRLRLEYDTGDLRNIRAGDLEIVRRIYVAFQDRNWTARPWQLEDESIEAGADSFRILLRARGTFDASAFTWTAEITGAADSAVRYAIEGSTTEPFLRNRLGLCVLHPMAGFAGRSCTIVTADGDVIESAFPDAISPHQPFLDVRAMEWPVGSDSRARLDFAGEVFETEDHRNWSDASYKTYCTPISLPFPVEVAPGDVIAQSVTLAVTGDLPDPEDRQASVTVTVEGAAVPLPRLGTQATDLPWGEAEMAAIAALGLDHLMATVDATAEDCGTRLAALAALAQRLDVRLRVRFAGGDADDYARIRDTVRDIAPLVDSWAVLHADEKVTSTSRLEEARDVLGDDLPWCGGTDLYFTELNRQPPEQAGLAWASFSINPQVHAADDRSVLQNAAAQEAIAADAPRVVGSARIAVGPVTLRPRFNPNATDPASDASNTELPASVDARQRTWFAAAWTLLSLRALTTPGTVDAVTYFEALGWRGLRERDTGCADPGAFGSRAGEEFPVYGVLRDLRGATALLPSRSDQPEVADAVVIEGVDDVLAFVVNMTSEARSVVLRGAVSATIGAAPQSVTLARLPRRSP